MTITYSLKNDINNLDILCISNVIHYKHHDEFMYYYNAILSKSHIQIYNNDNKLLLTVNNFIGLYQSDVSSYILIHLEYNKFLYVGHKIILIKLKIDNHNLMVREYITNELIYLSIVINGNIECPLDESIIYLDNLFDGIIIDKDYIELMKEITF